MGIVLCFDNGYGFVRGEIENIVGLLGLGADDKIALEVDLTVGDPGLHRDAVEAPFGLYCRRDILQLDVFLSHLFLVQDHLRPPLSSK
jgi:hypothetical protein